ncbi:hypothetical protein [Mesonia aestuariivivens]|uniref:Winged helix-turn-helix domain-containing protein n=1 Tax=Mesonia aestuariivivens TaxID=2796128 RepID=A0ABS6W350_9FLAO|nr:hypothetical protein [Mesonia aestuariivivens]MBW2962286.1 hypothetical protein [Mesonia aestuariivivens]
METLLKLIQENARKTGNLSGISLVKLAKQTGYSSKETIHKVKELVENGTVQIREGINNHLIFVA